ncbi:MAG: hypothetical protein Fur0034_02610 [Desulfuromonadia bacterium]
MRRILFLLTIPMISGAAALSASPLLDDLQMDAMIAITRLKGAPSADSPVLRQMQSLYAAGESRRNAGDDEGAADRFRQILSLAREFAPPPPPPLQSPSPLPDPDGDPPPPPRSPLLVGTEDRYVASRRESLKLISARLGISSRLLATMNGLSPDAVIPTGHEILYRNLRIVPKSRRNGIVINIPDRTLYLFKDGTLTKTVPVAVGKGNREKSPFSFETPTGPFRIVAKKRNPSWRVPPSIKKEMESRNKPLPDVVPPGKDNPLGGYALVTSLPGILIHGTNTPSSVYGFTSHGCIRVTPWEMEMLFREVGVATTGEIIYEPVKVLVTDDRRVFLEVNPDIYRRGKDPEKTVRRLLAEKGGEYLVDWSTVRRVIRERKGVAEDVTNRRLDAGRSRRDEAIDG